MYNVCYYSKRKNTQTRAIYWRLRRFIRCSARTTFVQQSQKVTEKPAQLETATQCLTQTSESTNERESEHKTPAQYGENNAQ